MGEGGEGREGVEGGDERGWLRFRKGYRAGVGRSWGKRGKGAGGGGERE